MAGLGFARKITTMISAAGFFLASAVIPAQACTGIRLIAADGSVVYARTLEFAIDIHSDVIVVPRGYARIATAPDDKDGLKWKAKYATWGERRWPAVPLRRPQREGSGSRLILLSNHRRIYALHAGRRRQDDRSLGTRFVDPGQLRHRRRGESEHRHDRRSRGRVQAVGIFAAGSLHRSRRLGKKHCHRIRGRQTQRL